jgi:hypothetical protein
MDQSCWKVPEWPNLLTDGILPWQMAGKFKKIQIIDWN